MEVVRVEGAEALDRFIRFPSILHRGDPAWVPPLLLERRAALTPGKNPYFEHAEVAYWLALRDGCPVGRISAQVDRLHLERHADATGHFGLIAAEDDAAVFHALTAAAEDWLRQRGMRRAIGPFDLSINQECGLLIDGFETPPMLMMGHARPYVAARLEAAGYRKAKDLYAYLYDLDTPFPSSVRRTLTRGNAPGVTVRPMRRSAWREELATALAIFNDAWTGNWGFAPLTAAEIDHMGKELKPLLDPRLVWFVEVDGEPAAMAVCLPNLNEAIADLNGRLLPFGWAKLAWRIKIAGLKTGRVPLMGVRRKFAGTIMGSRLPFLLVDRMRAATRARGYRRLELSWILEDNRPMRHIIESVSGTPYKTYRLYQKSLA